MLLGVTATAQPGKKVFISADMEGISGMFASDLLSAAGAEYGRSRKMMADDVNAATRPRRTFWSPAALVDGDRISLFESFAPVLR